MLQVIETDAIVCGVHLLPIYGQSKVPQRFNQIVFRQSLES